MELQRRPRNPIGPAKTSLRLSDAGSWLGCAPSASRSTNPTDDFNFSHGTQSDPLRVHFGLWIRDPFSAVRLLQAAHPYWWTFNFGHGTRSDQLRASPFGSGIPSRPCAVYKPPNDTYWRNVNLGHGTRSDPLRVLFGFGIRDPVFAARPLPSRSAKPTDGTSTSAAEPDPIR